MSAKGSGWRQKNRRDVDRRVSNLERQYRKYARDWVNETDDRRLFINLLNLLIEAEKSMIGMKNLMVKCAWIKQAEEDRKTLDGIIGYFTGKTARNGHYYSGVYQ